MPTPFRRRGCPLRPHPAQRTPTAWAAAACMALILLTHALADAATAHARANTISPGDEIDTTAADAGTRCTLGYTFTDPGTSINYGITAGHCNKAHGDYVRDHTTGAAGHFILTVFTPSDHLQGDYGLIDFGTNRSIRTMYGMPLSGISTPEANRPVCHDGIRTGIACGTLNSRLAGGQYLTNAIQSIPGDSGGPVWQLNPDIAGTATVVGIWLGEHIEADGLRLGRFISLTDVLVNVAAKTRVL